MQDAGDAPSLRLVRKLGRLAEIARVIDINRYDGEFGTADGGKIYYVFDTNIFQMFLKPFTFSRYVELFQSSSWVTPRLDFAVNSESALVSGEYLFSGELPHQEHRRVMISSWHHIELLDQIARLWNEVRETASSSSFTNDVQEGVRYLDKLCKLLNSHDTKLFAELLTFLGTNAVADNDRLTSLGFDIERRMEIFAVRAICQFLAEDRYTEPMEQLRRLLGEVVPFYSHEDFPKLQILSEYRKEFNRAKADWAKRIREADRAVQARRKRRLEQSGGNLHQGRARNSFGRLRHAMSITHDSSTLAWLDIISKHSLGPKQRIVFVTGDRVVLNACRRRNADDPDQTFFVRSAQHFAPLLNLNDADSDLKAIGNPKAHFAGMRSAIEQSLALLNLSLDEKDKFGRRQTHRITGRDNFLVDVEDRDGDIFQDYHQGLFELFFDEDWVSEKEVELNEIALPFQEMERLAVCSFSEKIIARVEGATALKLFRKWRDSGYTGDFGAAIEKAMKSLLEDVGSATMDFTIKSVPRFVATLTSEPSKLFGRAVYRVRLELPIGDGQAIPIEDYVKDLAPPKSRRAKSGLAEKIRDRLELLRNDPALLFCLAIVLAFRSERWSLAANMAELAAEAAIRESGELRGEIEYMRSVALRYRLASVHPDFDETSDDVWLRWLRVAEAAQSVALDVFPQDLMPVRHLRSLSEIAAARLAYLEWVAYGRIDRLRTYQGELPEFKRRIDHMFQDVRRGLEHCVAVTASLGSAVNGQEAGIRSEHAEAIIHHWQWNMVVADVTARKLVKLGLLASDAHKPLVTAAILKEISAHRRGHLVYDIYRAQLGPTNESALKRIASRVERGELSLALDLAVAKDLMAAHGVRLEG